MVKVAAEACMKDLKARFGELFLSENGIRVSSGSVDRILHELQSFDNRFNQNGLSSVRCSQIWNLILNLESLLDSESGGFFEIRISDTSAVT